MKTLAVLWGGIAASIVATAAIAAPKAESAMECGIAADMAVVARSLAACMKTGGNMDTVLGKRL